MHLLNYPATAALLVSPSLAETFKIGVIYLASVFFVLGVLVFIHEFGHYAVAKLCGVRVEVFSLGFGKRLWGFRRGDTDYRISLLPLGGYVKMTGENPMEARTGDPGEFTSHPRWQRFLIAIAGPAMNIILAIVVLTGVYMVHDEEFAFLSQPAQIGTVEPGSPADKAGIKSGDTITQIRNVEQPTWQQVMPEVMINPGQPVDVTVRRGDQVIRTTVTPKEEGEDRLGYAGWMPTQPPLVGDMEPDLPAAKAGIKTGDEIVAFNSKPVQNMSQFIGLLQESKDAPAQITVMRDNKELPFTVVPQLADDGTGTGTQKYRIGFRPANRMLVQQLAFRDAFNKSVASCKGYSSLLFRLIPKLIQKKNSIRQMSGPIGIMRQSGRVAMEGWAPLLEFMAMLSVSLAVLNILPFPILDGGLMLMLLIEGAIRRDIKMEIKERVYQAAFVCLILFAAVIIFNDVAKSFHG
jgi:regulator of sigma E protease